MLCCEEEERIIGQRWDRGREFVQSALEYREAGRHLQRKISLLVKAGCISMSVNSVFMKTMI
jgi:hypothetical protein